MSILNKDIRLKHIIFYWYYDWTSGQKSGKYGTLSGY